MPLDATWCHFMSCDTTWCHLMPLDPTWCHLMPLDPTWCHLMQLNATWCHLMHLDATWEASITTLLKILHFTTCPGGGGGWVGVGVLDGTKANSAPNLVGVGAGAELGNYSLHSRNNIDNTSLRYKTWNLWMLYERKYITVDIVFNR